ncbi:undecaprenyl-phosphate glucose phosphotransferase [Modicisalibacter luteus]|uniref:Undecaprenyl-phosphate glucose phosphotransferase n=1 Tax=Modicisalibacter luteus TaxID=453962 RepID=A0ABV7LYF6_9GAMM|nr:undecaprenyl-phosphate glucose phosphotransferase [Halomonas lutea]
MDMTAVRGRSLSNHYRWLTRIIAQCSDIAVMLLAGYIVYLAHFDQTLPPQRYSWAMLLGALVLAATMPSLGVYRTWRGRVLSPLLFKLMMGFVIAGLIYSSLLYFSGLSEQFSRVWVVAWFTVAFLGSVAVRAAVYPIVNRIRAAGRNRRHVVLIGDAHSCATAASHLRADPTAGYDIDRIFLMGSDAMGELSSLELQWQEYKANRVYDIDADEVWICLPLSMGNRVKEALADLGRTAANVRFMPDMRDFRLINHDISNVANLYLLDMACSPMSGGARFVKAVEDRTIAALILLLIAPVMVILAIGVKLSSPGPVFYRQERVSWNGKPFWMLKFRSMPVDSEKDGITWGGAQQKKTTKFGSFIRRTSLDELPQFINVLKGDMSIVGPRPERTQFVDRFRHEIPGYMQKHLMKAGITGWAQINGWRGDTDLEKRIECDLWYIGHWSVFLDLKIIFLTIFKGFISKNAY